MQSQGQAPVWALLFCWTWSASTAGSDNRWAAFRRADPAQRYKIRRVLTALMQARALGLPIITHAKMHPPGPELALAAALPCCQAVCAHVQLCLALTHQRSHAGPTHMQDKARTLAANHTHRDKHRPAHGLYSLTKPWLSPPGRACSRRLRAAYTRQLRAGRGGQRSRTQFVVAKAHLSVHSPEEAHQGVAERRNEVWDHVKNNLERIAA